MHVHRCVEQVSGSGQEFLHEAQSIRVITHTLRAPLCGCVSTSLRSAMVRFMPASCFHTGSARFRLRGLPVRIAMPRRTPAETARPSALRTDQTSASRVTALTRGCAVKQQKDLCHMFYQQKCTRYIC